MNDSKFLHAVVPCQGAGAQSCQTASGIIKQSVQSNQKMGIECMNFPLIVVIV